MGFWIICCFIILCMAWILLWSHVILMDISKSLLTHEINLYFGRNISSCSPPSAPRHRVLQKGWDKMIAFVSALEIFILPVASSLQQIKGSAEWQQRVLKWQLWERHPWSRLFSHKTTWPLLTSIHTLETGDCDFGYSFWLIKAHWVILH